MTAIDLGSPYAGETIDQAAQHALDIATAVTTYWWGQKPVSFVFNDTRVTLDSTDDVDTIVARYHTARRLGIDS